MGKSHLLCTQSECLEALGADVFDNRQMMKAWLEILTESENITTHRPEILQCFKQFLLSLTKPQHQTRFCEDG